MILGATITGSLTLNGVNLASITGSEASINALNSFTASAATTGSNVFKSNQTVTGSLDITGSLTVVGPITGTVTTASYVLNAVSASYALNATTSSYALVATSASYALAATSASYSNNSDLLDGRDSLTFANTGSNSFVGIQNINGDVAITGSLTTTGAITAQTLNVQQVTSSIVYSSGSNIFGNSASNTQSITGSLQVTGSTHYLLGNVGIGTTTPSASLDVSAGTSTGIVNLSGGSGGGTNVGQLTFNRIGTGELARIETIRNGGNDAGQLQFYTKPTAGSLATRMIIDTTGNVGIGTTTPSTAGGSFTGLDIRGSSGGSLIMGSTSTLMSYIYADSTALTLQTTGSIPILFVPAGTERMRITSGGNVGIGTTSPNGPLDVVGPTYAGLYTLSLVDSAAVAADIGGGIYFGGNYTGTTKTGWAGILGRKDNATDGQYGGYMAFQTRTHGSSPAERMRITSGGNVGIANTGYSNTRVTITGIGTTSSNYGLVVNNSSNGNLFLVRDDGVVTITSFTTNGLVGTSASGNISVVNSTYTEIATGTITYSMTSGASWGINNSFPATIRNYDDDGMAGSAGDSYNVNINRGVTFDLGSAKAVRRIIERGYSTKNLDEITVQYSTDNTNWTTIFVYPHVYSNTQKDFNFNPTGTISARYWRWYISGWTSTREVQNYYTYESIIYT